MKRFFRSGSFKTLVVIVAVILLGVIFAAISRNASTPLTSAIGTIFSPLNSLASTISESLSDVSASFRSSTLYQAEIVDLEQQLEEKRKQLADYDELK